MTQPQLDPLPGPPRKARKRLSDEPTTSTSEPLSPRAKARAEVNLWFPWTCILGFGLLCLWLGSEEGVGFTRDFSYGLWCGAVGLAFAYSFIRMSAAIHRGLNAD